MTAWGAISWARPEWLWGLALVPLVALAIVWSLRRRARALESFSEADVRARTQDLSEGRRVLRGALLVVGITALCLAAAGPQWGIESVTAPPVRQRVVFAVDVSRSMLARDVAPTRLDRARLAVRQLLAGLPAAEAGLVAFAGEATLAVPLTRDHDALELYLASVGPDWISDPSTDLPNAIAVALDAFGPQPGPGEAIVVLSDGEDQTGGVDAAVAVASGRGVEVESIGIGTTAGARIPFQGGFLTAEGVEVVTRLEPEALRSLAGATGGAYVELAGGPGDVGPVLARLRALDAGASEGPSRERKADRYRWPLVLALLCLGGEVALRFRGRRPPRPAPALAGVAALLLLGMGQADSPRELYESGRYREALLAWRHADRVSGADAADAYGRASAAYRMGEFREAAASWTVAARTVEDAGRATDGWYNAGNARYRIAEALDADPTSDSQRYWDAAVAAYREALLLDPDDQEAKHNLELALRKREQSGGGGGGAGGGGGGEGGGGGGGGRGIQPPSTGGQGDARPMTRSQAERLLDALAAQEREALARGEEERQAGEERRPGW
ncbi:MAG TPA: VWA domain-containing protein [Gemmatimonadota bacterium]|nr:VWA domain-containing protein [Gemmatimonadota bacterium]